MGQAGGNSPVLVTQLVNCLGIGGTERQLVEHLRRLRQPYTAEICCLQKVGEYLPVVRGMGYEPIEFNLRGTLMRPNTLVQVRKLAERLRVSGSRLLHCHDFYSNLIGALAARIAGIPYIISRRDLGVWIDWKREQALKHVTAGATRVLANAYAVRDQIVNDEGLPIERISVIHNGIDLAQFDRDTEKPLAAPLPEFDDQRPIVAMVANMKHPVKGHDDLLLAAAAVLRNVPEARFLLVGDGALRASLEERARMMGIAHGLIFAGKRTDVPAILTRCQVGVCSSHSEGLSNAIMESMAARLPMVATAVGGNIELVRDGRTGYVVRRSDPMGMAQRLVELLRDQRRAVQMGLAGRRRIEEEFSAELLAERTSALYADMLGLRREVRRAA